MPAFLNCPCGARVPITSAQPRCLNCGRELPLPPPAGNEPVDAVVLEQPHWSARMLAAMLDPRSIHWMLIFGGGLMVLGLIIWLVSIGVFKNPLVVAIALTLGSLAVHLSGCFVALKTKHKVAGHALTFLGCMLLPLNLWFYHTHGLVTLEGNLWLGGVVCCVLYIGTVVMLRDPLFMYAVEAGITLTVLLLLGQQGVIADATWLSLVCMALAFISIHAEGAFPADEETFNRQRFGLPLFWSGHVQLIAAISTLLGSQLLDLLDISQRAYWFSDWPGKPLTDNVWLATGLWLVGTYLYLYSDLVVRRLGWYVYAAAVCLIGAELTIIGQLHSAEWLIAAPALTAVGITAIIWLMGKDEARFASRLTPLATLLATMSVCAGLMQHVLTTSTLVRELFGTQHVTGWAFFLTMVLVAVCNRAMAVVLEDRNEWYAKVHLFLSAASVLVAAAGLCRCLEITTWTFQAPLLMLVPLGYLVASRLWQGRLPAEPLAISAHVGTGIIMLHVLFNCVKSGGEFIAPVEGASANLWLGLVFVQATIFYLAYAILYRQGANIYVATAAACGAVWQIACYTGIPHPWYTMLYAGLGLVMLAVSRVANPKLAVDDNQPAKPELELTFETAVFHSANGLLSLALLSGMLQGLAHLAARNADVIQLCALGLTTLTGLVAVAVAPNKTWRRIYAIWTIGLAGVSFLTLNMLMDLTVWQKAELFAVVVGLAILIASYIGRFMEQDRGETDHVTLGLWIGSLLPTAAVLVTVLCHRFGTGMKVSEVDEFGLVLMTVLMIVTGYAWQLKSPAVIGGGALTVYLLVLIGMLAYRPNVAMGVYLAVGGGLLFGAGVLLSIFRDRLAELPKQISNREGVFQVLNWR